MCVSVSLVIGTIAVSAANATVIAGNDHNLTCTVTTPAGLEVSYQWTHPNVNTVSTDQSYSINAVSITDAGSYTCTAMFSHTNTFVDIQNPTATTIATLTVTSESL